MRYVRIFFYYFQGAFAERGRSFVWFLISFLNPLILLLFWSGAAKSGATFGQWTLSDLASYYFLLIIADALLDAHIEETVARIDIQEGGLTKYLVQPFSYVIQKLFEESPWRMIQGFFGILVFLLFRFGFGFVISIQTDPSLVCLCVVMMISGYAMSFLFKMILGLSALWTTDYRGLSELVGVLMLIFAGFVMPLEFFHPILKQIAILLPFPYIIYFPIIAFQGKLIAIEMIKIILIQWVWICGFIIIYRKVWQRGVRLYTGIGQ